MTDVVSVIIEGAFKPYVRMTKRGKFVKPQAQQYIVSQTKLKYAMKEQLGQKGHRFEDLPIFKRGQPLRAYLLINVASDLHRKDLDNQLKSVLDAAQGLVFANDLWIDIITVERRLWESDYVELLVMRLPPAPRKTRQRAKKS